MSRIRPVGLALTAAAAVLTLGVVMAPAGASDTVQPSTASATATPTSPAPTTTPPPTSPAPTTTPPPTPGEGCTPGFWKNHPDAWAGTAYSPDTTLGSVFTGLPAEYADVTLLQALSLKGGGLEALLRQAVAALLNSTSAEVSYPLTASQIIALVNAAIASGDYESLKDQLDAANNLGAPGFCD